MSDKPPTVHSTLHPKDSDLGKIVSYDHTYNPNRLFRIARADKRTELGINLAHDLPFMGIDSWNHYEISWLNNKGKPIVAVAQIIYDCSSEFIVESKSLKLYFNSFNNSKFQASVEVAAIIKQDLTNLLNADVIVKIYVLNTLDSNNCKIFNKIQTHFTGQSIDNLDIECDTYMVCPDFLGTEKLYVEEVLCSDLLKSNCLVTNQPDWGSIQISYKGNKINQTGLLKYIVSYRNHNEFHEQCIERIFVDIMQYCAPKELSVYGRYTRRGGLDINPYRTNNPANLAKIRRNNLRLIRQ